MIFRHFEDGCSGSHSYLIASRATRQAALINPSPTMLDAYVSTLSELGLDLSYTLCTEHEGLCEDAVQKLETLCPSRSFSSIHPAGPVDTDGAAVPGTTIPLGDLEIEVLSPPRSYSGDVAYRISYYTFAGSSVLIDYHEGPIPTDGEPENLLDPAHPASGPTRPRARTQPIENFRTTREGVCIERLILEDLHTSLAESRFTPKEARVVRTYIRHMEENDFAHPQAAQLSEQLGDVDRTGVHVLVHNIRWKQIDLSRLPVVLAGQTSKWLRGLQRKPEFTPHEQAFLSVYLRLVNQSPEPPSGPEIAAALGQGRSVQWVRKRAHTIRRKQREFKMPELILKRMSPAPQIRGAFGAAPQRSPNDSPRFETHYGA